MIPSQDPGLLPGSGNAPTFAAEGGIGMMGAGFACPTAYPFAADSTNPETDTYRVQPPIGMLLNTHSAAARHALPPPPTTAAESDQPSVGGAALDGRHDRDAARLGLFGLLDVDFEHAVGVVGLGLAFARTLG